MRETEEPRDEVSEVCRRIDLGRVGAEIAEDEAFTPEEEEEETVRGAGSSDVLVVDADSFVNKRRNEAFGNEK
jgi:hypothetical protein